MVTWKSARSGGRRGCPRSYREQAPRTIKLPDGGDAILVEGQPPYPAPFLDLRAGRTNETWEPFGVTVDDTAGVGPPEQRLREQDMDALHAEVLFPNMQVGPRLWRAMADDDVYRATVRAYNDWLGEEYCAVSRDRLIGLGVIPWTNVDDAIAELEHCAKLGLKGVNLGVFPSGKAYPTPADDRFWAAAIDMKMPLTVHVGFDRLGPRASQPTFEYPGADPAMLAKLGPRKLVEWVALPFLGHRAVDELRPADPVGCASIASPTSRSSSPRHAWGGCRSGWRRPTTGTSGTATGRARLLNFKPLKQRPSDYDPRSTSSSASSTWSGWPSSCVTTWASSASCSPRDFPHIECDWPNTRPFAERLFAGVPAGRGVQDRGGQHARRSSTCRAPRWAGHRQCVGWSMEPTARWSGEYLMAFEETE